MGLIAMAHRAKHRAGRSRRRLNLFRGCKEFVRLVDVWGIRQDCGLEPACLYEAQECLITPFTTFTLAQSQLVDLGGMTVMGDYDYRIFPRLPWRVRVTDEIRYTETLPIEAACRVKQTLRDDRVVLVIERVLNSICGHQELYAKDRRLP